MTKEVSVYFRQRRVHRPRRRGAPLDPISDAPPGSPYAVLWVTSFGLLLMLVNNTSVNVALPQLSDAFGASTSVAGWFLLGFMLANTSSILIFGRVSDMFGRKRIYLWGLTAFMIASLLAAFSPNAAVFVALRAVQGVAAATIVSNTTAIVADAFPSDRLTHALSINLTAAAVGNTIGPAIGGVLVSAFGWQSVFLVNVPFGVVAVLLGLKYVPTRRVHEGTGRFDLSGAVLSVVGLAVILYGLDRMSSHGFGDVIALVMTGGGVLVLSVFVLVELRIRDPLVDMTLLRDVGRSCAYIAAFFSSFARAGVTVLVVLHQQMVCGRSAAQAGLVVMVMAIAMTVATPFVGRLTDVVGSRWVIGVGGALVVGGLGGLAASTAESSLVITSVWLVFVGLGIGLFTAPNTAAIMENVPGQRRTVANAVRSMLFNTAQAMSTSICLLVVATSGIASFAVESNTPAVTQAFTLSYLLCALTALLAMVFSLLRARPRRVTSRETVVAAADSPASKTVFAHPVARTHLSDDAA
ncbi:MFS transporter [Gordonia sp. CPCC 206044]|uniref:MFS transporter n=1 Tax=Gordonia sp. CPCC 206044 TaxID=3140793 RepID=UPI003AF38520